ncbi:MAG: hypothetical protein Q8P31_08280 [Bacillota bacterium]|nr:hypothetical protein [Bacillota bacterium]
MSGAGLGGTLRPIGPPGRPEIRTPAPGATGAQRGGFADFAAVLRAEVEGVKFSQHAQQRLQSRGLTLSDAASARLNGALGTLARKGGRTSLVLLDDLALVVSVTNRTVITAVPAPDEAVFTNIDSAIRA